MIHDVVHPTGNPPVTLTSYAHEQKPKLVNVSRRPAVLVLPGGSYEFCSDREGEPVAMALAGAGYQTFVLRYSVAEASTWPAPLLDAEAALQTIIDRADQWGVDPTRIAVLGFSAGGHLAASVSLLGRVRPAATLLVYPVIMQRTLRVCRAEVHGAPALLEAVDQSCPPTFIVHSAADELVPVANSLRLAAQLADHGIPFELHVFPGGPHGLALGTEFTSTGRPEMVDRPFASWLGLAIDWLGRQFPIG
ncbi:MAG: alpha/beta hydrolase [Brooklawnia sp.]|uniref:alpha/beta hydrolase n=1 Tax=Brooklawnia sp. TaxID=2699740 RepID=UPI003C74C48E